MTALVLQKRKLSQNKVTEVVQGNRASDCRARTHSEWVSLASNTKLPHQHDIQQRAVHKKGDPKPVKHVGKYSITLVAKDMKM